MGQGNSKPSRGLRGLLLFCAGLLTLASAGLTLSACGSSDEAQSELAALVPPDAPLFVEATVNPDDDQREAVESLASGLAGIDDPAAVLRARLEEALGRSGLSYAEDVEPWLGDRAGLFVRSFETRVEGMPDFAAAIETSDEAAAEDFLDRATTDAPLAAVERRYAGHGYVLYGRMLAAGLVGDVLAVGTEDAVKAAIDASSGESLTDSEQYQREVGALPGDPIVRAYVDLDTALEATVEAGRTEARDAAAVRGILSPLFADPIAVGLEVGDDTVALDLALASGEGVGTRATPLLASLPGDAWFAYGFQDAGEAVKRAVAELESVEQLEGEPKLKPGSTSRAFRSATGLDLNRELLSAIGDAAAFLRGAGKRDWEIGADLEVTEPAAASRVLDAARTWVGARPGVVLGPPLTGARTGFSAMSRNGAGSLNPVQDESVPAVVNVARNENLIRAAAAAIPRTIETEGASGTLADNESFESATDALGDGYGALGFVDVARLLDAAEGFAGNDAELLDPLLQGFFGQLAVVAVGTRASDQGDGFLVRVAVRLDD